jgi:hypothetical protein
VVTVKILVIRPDYETATHWGQYWYDAMVCTAAKKLGYDVIDLYAKDATRERILEACQEYDLALITGVGHGNEKVFTVQNGYVAFQKGDEKTAQAVIRKHVHLTSCIVRKELGKWMIEQGAIAFQGFDDVAYFFIDENNYPNSVAIKWYTAFVMGTLTLLEGETEGASLAKAQQEWEEQAEQMTPVEKAYAAHNLAHLGLEGDPESTLSGEEPEPPPTQCPWCGATTPYSHTGDCLQSCPEPCPEGFWACLSHCFSRLFSK